MNREPLKTKAQQQLRAVAEQCLAMALVSLYVSTLIPSTTAQSLVDRHFGLPIIIVSVVFGIVLTTININGR